MRGLTDEPPSHASLESALCVLTVTTDVQRKYMYEHTEHVEFPGVVDSSW